MANSSTLFDRDKFFINQKRFSIKEKYYVFDEEGNQIFFVARDFRWFGLGRRNIGIFENDSQTEPLLSITQDHYFEIFNRNYTVIDQGGNPIAKLSRNNLRSLLRRSWNIAGADGTAIGRAREDSAFMAAVRRIVDLIPYLGLIGGIFKTDFHLLAPDGAGGEQKIGSFNRKITFFDKYVLDLTEDPERRLDRRVALALGILLDTAEKR